MIRKKRKRLRKKRNTFGAIVESFLAASWWKWTATQRKKIRKGWKPPKRIRLKRGEMAIK